MNSFFAWCHAKRKRCYTPFKSLCRFLLRAQKKFGERKGHRCAVLVGRIPRTGFAGCCGRPSGVALGATFEVFLLSFIFYRSTLRTFVIFEIIQFPIWLVRYMRFVLFACLARLKRRNILRLFGEFFDQIDFRFSRIPWNQRILQIYRE